MSKKEEKKFDKSTARPLVGHVNQETAFVQLDYPYGRRLRCQRRVWIETNPRYGMRLVTQTSNPKRRSLVWNKPKTSTYSDLVALWVDDKDFIATDSIYDGHNTELEKLQAWGERNQALLEADDYVRHWYEKFVAHREDYEERREKGEVKLRVRTYDLGTGQTTESSYTVPAHPADQQS